MVIGYIGEGIVKALKFLVLPNIGEDSMELGLFSIIPMTIIFTAGMLAEQYFWPSVVVAWATLLWSCWAYGLVGYRQWYKRNWNQVWKAQLSLAGFGLGFGALALLARFNLELISGWISTDPATRSVWEHRLDPVLLIMGLALGFGLPIAAGIWRWRMTRRQRIPAPYYPNGK